jgi:hypothetical protein
MEKNKAPISDQLSAQVQAFTAWKQGVAREIGRYRSWLNNQGLNNDDLDMRLSIALRTLKFDRILLAFVGEFSRGKSELINAILGKHYGQRLLPTRSGRTTMCPTELFYDPQATGAFIKLLPIQTRGDAMSLSAFKKQMEHWVHLPINLDDPASMRKAFTEVAQTREVSSDIAAELGFQVEYLESVLGKPGHVHIPAWRHALINIDHPLLRQGLAIIDTPGLNALGSEPELTLSLLPDAQALVFVLSADAGVTASDFAIWNSHVRDVATRRGTVLYAVLNKIDLLWDEDEDEREIEDSLRRLVRLTAQQLHLPEDHVMPITAKQAYKARINANEELFALSRLGSLEHALARSVVSAKESVLKATILQELASMVESSRQAIISQRGRLETEARVMVSGKRDSEYELVALTRAAQQEQASYNRRLSILQQSRKLLENQMPRIIEPVSEERLNMHFEAARETMNRLKLSLGVPTAVSAFFQVLNTDMIRLKAEVDTTEQLVQTLYMRYVKETGSQVPAYPRLDAGRYLRELAELEHQAAPYKSRLGSLLANQQKVFDRFFETLAREAGELYKRAREDSQRWCKMALAPLMQQALEAKSRLEKQMSELQRLKTYGLTHEERADSLGAERDGLQEQQALLEDILINLRGAAPESAVPTLAASTA